MKSLNTYLQEGLRIGINDRPELCPTTFDELRKIIIKRFEELGPGTKQKPIDFNDVDVSGMTTFYNAKKQGIFQRTEFKYINVSDWDVSHVEDMCSMFYFCMDLKSIGDLSNWDVSNVNNMSGMFYGCEKLESIGNLSNWDISSIKDMNSMFGVCIKLKSIGDISNWNVSNVINMRNMFYDSSITNIPDWYQG